MLKFLCHDANWLFDFMLLFFFARKVESHVREAGRVAQNERTASDHCQEND
jgi:hypothetical protein